MSTTRFQPTPSWLHALGKATCPCHLLLVVENQEDLVGWCRVFPTGNRDDAREATLGIGLLQSYRDRGIGTALVRRALDWAQGAGYQRISLTTDPDNARAVQVFTKCEFVFTGGGEDNSLEMARDLRGGKQS